MGREFESHGRAHCDFGDFFGDIHLFDEINFFEKIDGGRPAVLRPFGSIPETLGIRPRRVGIPPTSNMHVTDTLPDE
jgi:hypothetical protein